MASNPRGLGSRDLGAARQQAAQTRIIQNPPSSAELSELLPSPENGRDVQQEKLDPRAWQKVVDLAEAFKVDGVSTALTVVPAEVYIKHYPQHTDHVRESGRPYVVIHGHRRLAAAHVAGLTSVPILLKMQVVSIRIAAIQENSLREPLDPIAEGIQYREAMQEEKLSQRELASRLGNVSQTTVSHRIAILDTIPEVQAKILDEHYTPGTGIGVSFAAKNLARVRPSLQKQFVDGVLQPFDIVALSNAVADVQEKAEKGHLDLRFVIDHLSKLRRDLQELFLEGSIDEAGVVELSRSLPKEQRWPLPAAVAADLPEAEVIAEQSPAGATGRELAEVPTPRTEALLEQAPSEVIAEQSAPPASAANNVAAGPATSAASVIAEQSTAAVPAPVAPVAVIDKPTPVPAAEKRIILVESASAEEIAQALIDNLTPEVLAAVREYLA
ncbi:ParB/RepB/Spo0J family partition protein [Streptomyces sp. NRRL B-24484]|uniref:ParB/RepB/Spo0J family partition protein n=1 Tax=Streptomyces sp. NRRL B-24484 TaxID=1463833 RepID=UPI0004C0F74B|nr:ParB/RepB/Spo0J family partition protein [Streptomyces sp. NRRL B-24484]